MADAYSGLMRSPDLIGHLLAGFPLEVLMREVTCGDVGVQGALVVGPTHYDMVLDRLDEPLAGAGFEKWRERDRRRLFLATRCGAAFLERWCGRNADIVEGLAEPGLMLQAMSDNQLVARLSELRLFPERLRVHFAEQLMAYCLSGYDPAVLYDETLKSVLTAAEWEALLLRVRSELLDDLHGAIHTCTADADLSTTDLESVVEPLSTLALHLPDLFPGDDYVAQRAQELDSLLDQWMSDNQSEARPERHDRRPRGSAQADRDWSHGLTRSVFDDLLDGREDVS